MFKRVKKDPELQSFWGAVCSNISVAESFKSIFRRRPSSLHALDGMRAIAVLWVITIHIIEVWP
jgi:hypothetical protein